MCDKSELEAFVGQRKPIPGGCFVASLDRAPAHSGPPRWRSKDGERIYTWDALHGEVEVFNKRGRHLGAVDPCTGDPVKAAERGRSIDV